MEGCNLLRESGHFDDFVATISDSWAEKEDAERISNLKGCLWAVGNIGSMELGAAFLEESDVVSWIVKIAEQSEVTTIRGTAFFILGLVSRTLHGMEMIAEHGWTAATDQFGRSVGYCFPSRLGVFFSVRNQLGHFGHWRLNGRQVKFDKPLIRAGPRSRRNAAGLRAITDDDPVHARVLNVVANLGNAVLGRRAAADLNRSVSCHPHKSCASAYLAAASSSLHQRASHRCCFIVRSKLSLKITISGYRSADSS